MNNGKTTNQYMITKSPQLDMRHVFYLLALGIYMSYSILGVSFYQSAIGNSGLTILKLCFALLVVAELTDFSYRQSDLLGIIGIALIMLVTYNIMENVWWRPLLWIAVFMFGARHIPFKKIAKFALIVSVIWFAFIVLSSKAGIIPDYLDTTTHPGVTRHYLGFLYCLFPPTLLFNIEALYIYLRKDKIKWFELLICLVVAYIFYKYCDARLNFMLNGLMIVGAGVVRYRGRMPKKFKNMCRHISKCLPWIFIVCALISVILSFGYTPHLSWMEKINSALGGRLKMGKLAFQRYGLSAWGQNIEMRGNGLRADGTRGRSEYFYIDCLYVRFLQEYGIIFSVIMLALLTIAMYRMWQKRKYLLLIILSVLALHAVVDDLILLPYYNIFWIVLSYFIFPTKSSEYSNKKITNYFFLKKKARKARSV
jgi:hypothetical protein